MNLSIEMYVVLFFLSMNNINFSFEAFIYLHLSPAVNRKHVFILSLAYFKRLKDGKPAAYYTVVIIYEPLKKAILCYTPN